MRASWGIHWFRRDLRVTGNPALQWNWKHNQGRVVGLFCFDSKFLSRRDFSQNRFAFFVETLCHLKEELQTIGSDLWVIDCLPQIAFPKIHEELNREKLASLNTVTFNRDYEPFARQRDDGVTSLLQDSLGIQVHTERDHLLFEPWEITKSTNHPSEFYQVYTPYAKKWFKLLNTPPMLSRVEFQKSELSKKTFHLNWNQIWEKQTRCFPDSLEHFKNTTQKHLTIALPKAGSQAAYDQLNAFKSRIMEYEKVRDIPSLDGTSRLSIYLKNGSLTTSQMISELDLTRCNFSSNAGATKFLKELVWREFYYSILYFKPQVEQEAFNNKYKNIRWENDEILFEAWKEGRTGYPIVDAGMRQLKREGWMHNRVRMIVASFLVKDLLIDWRWGENHFMKELLDGDLAPNNGGWQWAASTGCDPQPYFRIFNPELQSQKFDPTGAYIMRYVPELIGLNAKQIHAPYRFGTSLLKRTGYPSPIVEHASRKLKALALFQSR